MWRSWSKSTVKIHDTSSPSPSSSSPSFSFPTFKDIQHLLTDDLHPSSSSSSSTLKRTSSIFHRVRLANSVLRSLHGPARLSDSPFNNSNKTTTPPPPPPVISFPGADKRIVVYFTSLRVVRSTFEDCRTVRSILRAFRVSIDERDLAMDSSFLNELQEIFGSGQSKLTLPRVFIGGRYMGGAEEIRQLHDAGELKKFVEGLPAVEPGVCDVCGGHRFVLCNRCNGSHKLYIEKAGFKSCASCNENGLIRCSSCSSALL